MRNITPDQVKLASILINKLGQKEERQNLALFYSENRTKKISELKQEEAQNLITALKQQAGQPEKPNNKMIRAIHSKCRQMHWVNGKDVDMDHLQNFIDTRTKLNKPFDQLNYPELQKLVSVLDKVKNDFLKAL